MDDPLKIEDEMVRFSFEDEEIEDDPLRNEDTMDLIMEMSKKRQEVGIRLRNWPPNDETGRRRRHESVARCFDRTNLSPFYVNNNNNNWILDHNVMVPPEEEISKEKTKKGVLIGLKHPRINNTDDVKDKLLRIKVKLMELRGFTEDNITLMMDQDEEEEEPIRNNLQPTDFNIRRMLFSLLHSASRGDILYIHLIAYGCSDGRIITSDKDHIEDSFFRGLLIVACEEGYNLTLVSDCLIEPAACSCEEKIPTLFPALGDDISVEEARKKLIEYRTMKLEVSLGGFKILEPTNLSYVDILNTPNEEKKKDDDDSGVILLTPSATFFNPFFNASELFIPNALAKHTSYGVFTNAILDVIEETHGKVTNLELAQKAMKKFGRRILPTLRCSDHNHAHTSFLC
ncbi:hypothetical protein TSUD_307770 [Trifolium subterraneum]|nr:hypothetical protein TSUD_307770 [Trifolium subterraneum]